MSVAVCFDAAVFSADAASAVMMQGNMAEFEAAGTKDDEGKTSVLLSGVFVIQST